MKKLNEIQKEQLRVEINHIIDSGVNDIRLINMIESFCIKYFPEAFDKPERVKKVFEVEFQDHDTDFTSDELQDALTSTTFYNNGSWFFSVKEVTDKADCANPTPEREGLNVRIEWDKPYKVTSKIILESLATGEDQFLSRAGISVKEIGAGWSDEDVMKFAYDNCFCSRKHIQEVFEDWKRKEKNK